MSEGIEQMRARHAAEEAALRGRREAVTNAPTLRGALVNLVTLLDHYATQHDHGKDENETWRDEADDELRETYEQVAADVRGILERHPEDLHPRVLLERLAADAWVEARQTAEADGMDLPIVVRATTRTSPDPDGQPLDVLIGRLCGQPFMAGTLCSQWVDDDGEHDGPHA